MNMTVTRKTPPEKPPVIAAPPSKSAAHRQMILSALSDAKTPVLLRCNDTNADMDATAACLTAIGARIDRTPSGFSVTPIKRETLGEDPSEKHLYVGESGSTLRFFLPILGALGISAALHMEGRLPDRPLAPLDAVLSSHGMTLTRDGNHHDILHVSGTLTPGNYTLDGGVSSQYITGLLLALPLLSSPSRISITGQISSRPYLAMTEEALTRFGASPLWDGDTQTYSVTPCTYKGPGDCAVEGDYSGAAFLLCAGALLPCGVTVTGLQKNSTQGDRAILSVLERAGCTVSTEENAVTVTPPSSHLIPFSFSADDTPDLVPPVAVLAAGCKGVSRITGCGRLRIKESDRLAATVALLGDLGGRAEADADSITVYGTGCLWGGSCHGVNDHRMVMSGAIAALITETPVTVSDAEAIRKSYPSFFEAMSLCGTRSEPQ